MEAYAPQQEIKKKVKEKKERPPGLFDNVKEIVKVAFKEVINTKPEYTPAKKSKIARAKSHIEGVVRVVKDRKRRLPSKIWDQPEDFSYHLTSGRNNLVFTLQKKGDINGQNRPVTVGNFYLEKLKGCAGIAVLYYLGTTAGYTNRGYGTFMHDLAERIAYDLGMFLIQGTVTHHMTNEVSLLSHRKGWNRVGSFKNRNSGNQVFSYVKALR